LAGAAIAGEHGMSGKCVKVVDGDTLVIECDQDRRTVELAEVDAPELEQPWGKEVRNFVRDLVKGRQVELEVIEQTDGPVQVRVTVNGQDLSEMLVSRGLAWVPEDGDNELSELCDRARNMPCGLWNDADPTPPWEFREARL
jgi:endonuclease YncB( thermonuclease family)